MVSWGHFVICLSHPRVQMGFLEESRQLSGLWVVDVPPCSYLVSTLLNFGVRVVRRSRMKGEMEQAFTYQDLLFRPIYSLIFSTVLKGKGCSEHWSLRDLGIFSYSLR